VFSPFGKDMAASGPDSDEPRLFLVVYQHGNSIWAGPPASAVCFHDVLPKITYESAVRPSGSAADAPCHSWQGGLVPFEIGVSVVGDVTIALWRGDHNMGERIHSRPSFAYAFHTAFVAEGLERVTMRQLDIFDQTVLPATPAAQAAFFMDVTFDDEVTGTKATCAIIRKAMHGVKRASVVCCSLWSCLECCLCAV